MLLREALQDFYHRFYVAVKEGSPHKKDLSSIHPDSGAGAQEAWQGGKSLQGRSYQVPWRSLHVIGDDLVVDDVAEFRWQAEEVTHRLVGRT